MRQSHPMQGSNCGEHPRVSALRSPDDGVKLAVQRLTISITLEMYHAHGLHVHFALPGMYCMLVPQPRWEDQVSESIS